MDAMTLDKWVPFRNFSPAAAALAREIIQDLYASVGMLAPDARP
jgi:hypothetical protein